MWWITLQLGVRNLLLHKLRSFLTMLGTILGVGSVIAMLAIGEGSKRKAVEQIRELGATNVIIRSVKPEPDNDGESTSSGASQQQTSRVLEYGLKYRDFERLRDTIPTVVRSLPISLLRKDAQHGRRRISNARILGTTPQILQVKSLKLRRGRFLTDTDLKITANVCVLAAGAAQRLFGYRRPAREESLAGLHRLHGDRRAGSAVERESSSRVGRIRPTTTTTSIFRLPPRSVDSANCR